MVSFGIFITKETCRIASILRLTARDCNPVVLQHPHYAIPSAYVQVLQPPIPLAYTHMLQNRQQGPIYLCVSVSSSEDAL